MLAILFTAQPKGIALSDSQEQHAMKTNLSNLTTVYQTAMGEIPRNEEDLERWLPVIWAIDQFGYLLYSYTKVANRPELTDQELSKVLLIFEKMAQSADQQRNVLVYDIPSLILLPKVSQELWSLQNTLENSIVLNSQH
ncbi:hypothetical protein JCM16418_1155 [Paenibacillus pini JCM 16418]|uniref:Uncharacterized protein n=2 Tax=Paenibacillus TaxID=44249 RepID=W7YXP7_9BACL|nr:hypothetical protein JCM16418_1155 [Paenibacillus pini JCM 16418]